jgi:hypothetical protein
MSEERDGYQAYLLRLWRVPCRGKWQWRASLESSRTGERQLFAGLEQLFAFLGERCDGQEVETRGRRDLGRGDAERSIWEIDSNSEGDERSRR